MTDRKNLYIPSIDAKDLCIANANGESGYKLIRNGDYNLRRFINSFDYSLDLIELRGVARKVYYGKGDKLSFKKDGKEYSSKIINVTFKYSVKEFNCSYDNIYVRYGYSIEGKDLKNNYIVEEDENGNSILTAVCIDKPCITKPDSSVTLPSYIHIEYNNVADRYFFRISGSIPTIFGRARLRHMLYEDGFKCDGIQYCRFKRSSGSARVGKCLFIDERLYPPMHESEKCGLSYKRGDSIDLAALEAYISLTSSSIIDTIPIEPKNILLIDDYESVFREEAVCTDVDENNQFVTSQKLMTIKNSIWDGQSLIDKSLMGPYGDKGCILLRNKFFKSCCFNTNIQLYFEDFGITDISQLNGRTIAEDIKDIKLITTPSSIKYLKFGPLEDWLTHIYPEFGIVKYDKNTHFFDGRLVQGHYQLINTLQLSEEEVKELVQPELDYLNLLNTDLDVLRFHLKLNSNEDEEPDNVMPTNNDVVCNMLQYENDFDKTKIFNDFRHDLCHAYQKNMKKGHILLNGTYATLFGNPYEMLKQSIGRFDGESSMKVGTVHNIRFEYGTDLLGCRSPSVAIGNLLLTKNAEHLEIDRYFNLTNNIICINSINENILERLSGADCLEESAFYGDIVKINSVNLEIQGVA